MTIYDYLYEIAADNYCDVTEYEGIPSQTIPEAIRSCRNTMMASRLVDATHRARELGLIHAEEETALLEDLRGDDKNTQ